MAAKKLLVADDSLTIQKVIRLALSGATSPSGDAYEIQTVSDGNEAVQQISLFRPDIVLIDVSLPGKTAFEVKRAINEHRDLDDVRFVLMSSAFEQVDENQAEEVVFHGRLTKPFDPGHLREVLGQVLAQVAEKKNEPTVFLNSAPSGMPELPTEVGSPPPLPSYEPSREISREIPRHQPSTFSPPPSIPGLTLQDPAASDFPPLPEFQPSSEIPGMPEMPEQEGDIRALTESTIRMSGLVEPSGFAEAPGPPEQVDEFGWSVQEPSLRPPTFMGDTGESSFPFTETAHSHQPSQTQMAQNEARAVSRTTQIFSPPPPAAPQAQPQAAPQTMNVTSQQIEEMVRREVEAALEKMAQRLLPDVAERVIKQEIRNLLLDQP